MDEVGASRQGLRDRCRSTRPNATHIPGHSIRTILATSPHQARVKAETRDSIHLDLAMEGRLR